MNLSQKVKRRVADVLTARHIDLPELQVDKAITEALKGLTRREWLLGQLYNEEMCEACGGCCVDSPIRLETEDVKYLASFLDLSPQQFHTTYALIEKNGEMFLPAPCPFLKEDKCTVYVARPLMCRMYPFNQKPKTATFPKKCVFPEKLYALRALYLLEKNET